MLGKCAVLHRTTRTNRVMLLLHTMVFNTSWWVWFGPYLKVVVVVVSATGPWPWQLCGSALRAIAIAGAVDELLLGTNRSYHAGYVH